MKTWWMSRETRKVEPTQFARDEGNCRTFDRESLRLNSERKVGSMTSSTVPVEIRHFSAEQAALSTGTFCR